MGERFGLRLRFALFFAAIALGGIAVFGAGLWLGARHDGLSGTITAGLVGAFGLIGITAWIALLFDENVARPILSLAADLHTRARTGVRAEIDTAPARYLGALAPAAQAINEALEEARESQERAVAEKTERMARDNALFEALLRDLAEGVIVISPEGRILLYNSVAADLLGPLGLDRRLSSFLRTGPLDAAAERARDGEAPEPFLSVRADGARIMRGTVAAVKAGERQFGQVILFSDATEGLRIHADLQQILSDTVEAARRPASAMGAILDVLGGERALSEAERASFGTALRSELDRLSEIIEAAAERRQKLEAQHWPIRDVPASDILQALADRFGPALSLAPSMARLRGDGFAITEIIAGLLEALRADGTREALGIAVETRDGEVHFDLGWQGERLAQGTLERWLDRPFSEAYGRYTARDALEIHHTDAWVETAEGGGAIKLTLSVARDPVPAGRISAIDFYDFDILSRDAGALEDRALDTLPFVVFDTETTGLDPARDDVVQIAGIRMLGARVLRAERFDRYVNPGRRIPPASTAIHGVTDAMVEEAPPLSRVAAELQGFSEDAVLVAHNAPFDMAFLRRLAADGGPVIDQPVLCTARLSQALFSHTGQHTLDAIAQRFGVEIPEEDRHTALGDAIATAEVLHHLLPLLAERGCLTLGDAIRLQGRR